MASNPSTVPTALELAITEAKAAVEHARQLRLQLAPDLVPDGQTSTTEPVVAQGVFAFTRAEPETWTVHRVERQVAAAREALDHAVAPLREAGGTRAHASVQALLDVATALLELGREVNTGRARLVDYTVPHDGNVAQVAFWLYGDMGRRAEIIALNKLSDPNKVRAGTVLQVLER